MRINRENIYGNDAGQLSENAVGVLILVDVVADGALTGRTEASVVKVAVVFVNAILGRGEG